MATPDWDNVSGSRPGSECSARELEVLRYIATSSSQKEAAARMGMSYQTLKNHLQSARDRFGVPSTLEVFRALGWLNPDLGSTTARTADLEARLEAIHRTSGDLLAELRRERLEAVA